MVIVIIGPSGSGKDTQANFLVKELGIPNISTGKVLRDEIEADTELGRAAAVEIAKGNWIDDQMMYELLVNRISQPDCEGGFILNGFPRTHHQIELLDQILDDCNQTLKAVIHFSLEDDEVMKRLKKQVAEVEQRPDITEEAMKQRIKSYKSTIDPILFEYEKRGILVDIDASPSIEEVHKSIQAKLKISEGLS